MKEAKKIKIGDMITYSDIKCCVANISHNGHGDVVCAEFMEDKSMGWEGGEGFKKLYYPNYVSKYTNRFINVYIHDSAFKLVESEDNKEKEKETYLFP